MKGLDTVNEVDGCPVHLPDQCPGNAMFAIFLFDYFHLNALNVLVIL